MRNRSVFLILFAALALAIGLAASVSAQDVNVDSMTNEELLLLLQSIMERLDQQEEDPETRAAMDLTPEPAGFSVYENKKLTIEELPEYMFIQPTQPPKPEKSQPSKDKPSKPDNTPEHYENEPGIDDIDGGPCTWSFWDGQWRCMKG